MLQGTLVRFIEMGEWTNNGARILDMLLKSIFSYS